MKTLLATLATFGIALLLSPLAHAQGDVPEPPDQATAAPSTSPVPAAGDGTNYWASDKCHYFQKGGAWFSDMCLQAGVGVSGETSPEVVGLFQNMGNGTLGREMIRVDGTMPGYLTLGLIDQSSYTVTMWARAPLGNPSQLETLSKTSDGQPTWVSLPKNQVPQGGTGGNPPKADPQLTQLGINVFESIGKAKTDFGRFCTSSPNGC
jgi:hypothetical protein